MKNDESLALFLMLGQTAEHSLGDNPNVAPHISIPVSDTIDMALLMPEESKDALETANSYILFYVFEQYLRAIVQETLTKLHPNDWWDKIPPNVQEDIQKLEATEEIKNWMALGLRDRFALMTFQQLIAVIDHNWKSDFDELIGDKGLLHEARLIGHLRNRVAHMSSISFEERDRIKQTIRDWFRRVSP